MVSQPWSRAFRGACGQRPTPTRLLARTCRCKALPVICIVGLANTFASGFVGNVFRNWAPCSDIRTASTRRDPRVRRSGVHLRASGTGDRSVAVSTKDGPVEFVGRWWNETAEFWDALEIWNTTPLKDDSAPEAVALKSQLDLINATLLQVQAEREARRSSSLGRATRDSDRLAPLIESVPGLMAAYYRMRLTRTFSKRPVKRGIASMLLYTQVLIFGLFLRVLAPRMLAAGSMDDLFDAATSLGIPDRQTLAAGLEYIQSYDPVVKIALYTVGFMVEKAFMVTEVLPIQIALKTVSPVIFGGLVQGALASAFCETLGASFNHLIGRMFLTERLRGFSVFDMPPLSDASWFGKVEQAAKDDGFQLTLLLRLAPVLPLPFDSYWYLLGALGVPLQNFAPAHFLGCLKTSFLDASFGVLILETIVVTDATVQAQAQQILLAETLAFALVAALVSTVATKLVNELLDIYDDEDVEVNELASGGNDGTVDAAALQAAPAAVSARRAD